MRGLGLGQIAILLSLLALLVLAIVWATIVWNEAGDAEMGAHGWIALGLGTFFSLVVGGGLMALMFYSNRSGHDAAADPFRRREPPET